MTKISSFLQNNHSYLILLNKHLYTKILFIEEDFVHQEFLKVVDNNDFFTLLFCKNNRSLQKCGSSLNIRSVFFFNVLNIKIKFYLKTAFFSNVYKNFLKSIHKVIFCLTKFKQLPYKKRNCSVIFLYTMRSGFKVMYLGVVGFFPNSSFIFLFLKIINAQFLKNFFFILFLKNFYSKLLLRLSFLETNIEFRLLYLRRKKFVIKKSKRYFLHTGVNFVFFNQKKKSKVFLQDNFNKKNK